MSNVLRSHMMMVGRFPHRTSAKMPKGAEIIAHDGIESEHRDRPSGRSSTGLGSTRLAVEGAMAVTGQGSQVAPPSIMLILSAMVPPANEMPDQLTRAIRP